MIGALIGDLAATAWLKDRKLFYRRLVDFNLEPSVYGHALMRAASRNVLSDKNTPTDPIGEPGHITYIGQWLMWQVMNGWLDNGFAKDMPQFFSIDKPDLYAGRFIIDLIKELRKGATKSEAFNKVWSFKNLIQHKTSWNWKFQKIPNDSEAIVYVFRAWDSFYHGFDFTSSIHNAMQWPGDKHLLGALTGAFADAMYGCRNNLTKEKFNGKNALEPFYIHTVAEKNRYHHALIMEMENVSWSRRDFIAKNQVRTNVEYHHWKPCANLFEDIVFTEEEYILMLQAALPTWDCRYGFYLDDGWIYIYRSRCLISRFKMEKSEQGWRITKWELSGELGFKDSLSAFNYTLLDGCKINTYQVGFRVQYATECKYFNGEIDVPEKWKDTLQGKFWYGEQRFTALSDFKPWEDRAATWLKDLKGEKKTSFEKYTDQQRAIICYIETLFTKWCPYENMDWIFEY